MENTKDSNAGFKNGQAGQQNNNTSPGGRRHHKAVKIVGFTVGGLILAVILLCFGVSLYLTPDRLKRIANEEGSRYLNADVRVGNIGYTFWSSFPNLRIAADSIIIDSRTLDGVSPSVMAKLPKDSKRLATVERISGGVNVWEALRGDIRLKDIKIIRPSCNIVMVNDSVNNFNIFPKIDKEIKIPHIAVNTIDVGAPVEVKVFSLPSNLKCNAAVRNAGLRFTEGKKDNYTMSLSGDVDVKSAIVSTVNSIPFNINSKIAIGFSPLTVTVSELHADIADLKTISDLSLIAGSQPAVSKLNLDMSCSDVLAVTKYFAFPEENRLNGITGTLPVYAKLNLESPYEIPEDGGASPAIPAFSLSVNIPGGEVGYPVAGKDRLSLHDVALQADLHLDPAKPDASVLLVPMARATADGASVEASGTITELMSGDPLMNADIKCIADLAKAGKNFIAGNKMTLAGTLNGGSSISCRLSGLKDKKLKDLNVKGDFRVSSLKINDAVSKLTADLQDLSLKLRATVPSLSTSGLGDSKFNMVASSGSGKVTTAADSSEVTFQNLAVNGKFGAKGSASNPTVGGKLNVNAGSFNSMSPGMQFDASGVVMVLNANLRHVPWSAASGYSTAPTSADDSIISHRVEHTPLYLVASLPPMFQTGLSLLNLAADVKIGNGRLLADGYPVSNEFANLDMWTNLDTLTIHGVDLSTRGAQAQLAGNVYGLRGFLMSATPMPLRVDMDAHLGDVNINELSGNYYMGQARLTGKPAEYKVAPLGAYTAADSLCVLIPRNLYADLRLHADRAEYMQWQFSPLSTEITLHDGVAKIGDLTIGSGFGSVVVDWTYSTANLHDIFMQLKVGVNDFDFENFFKTFPMVTASAPELANLSGSLSAHANGKLLMFPDMFVNAPSMTADVNVHASDMEFKREGKIKRITNLMLIKGDTPLQVNNIDMHGSFHDNLLQLDPFMLDCGPYRLGVAGVNNLQGEIYYHLGIHGSPLHIPFGVNLVGNWRHPAIRFGGAGVNDRREREIASNLKDNVNVNIMRELKHGWLLFVENAAKYDAENNQQYVFNVD